LEIRSGMFLSGSWTLMFFNPVSLIQGTGSRIRIRNTVCAGRPRRQVLRRRIILNIIK
jgi:hypothetical protein